MSLIIWESAMTKYVVTVLREDHPMYGDFFYDVKKYVNGLYTGDGRFCRDLEDVYRYLKEEAER